MPNFKVKQRQLKALKVAAEELKSDDLKILAMLEEDEELIAQKKVKIVTTWKWLISSIKSTG